MYLKKRQREGLNVLILRMKVKAKSAAKRRATTGTFGEEWDVCEYCHMAFEAIMGDREQAAMLREAQAFNSGAREAMDVVKHYGLEELVA